MTGSIITELARRTSDGIDVVLQWDRASGGLAVTVSDLGTGDSFELAAPPESALDVFHHPFAYAAFRGVDYEIEIESSRGARVEALPA